MATGSQAAGKQRLQEANYRIRQGGQPGVQRCSGCRHVDPEQTAKQHGRYCTLHRAAVLTHGVCDGWGNAKPQPAEPPTVRELMLRNALSNAIEQLEGWVAWKCPKKHQAEHEAFLVNLRAVRDGGTESYEAFIKASRDADAVLRDQALTSCLDVMLRMIPGYCARAGVQQVTDIEHNEAIHRAAITLHGPESRSWPKHLVAVLAGDLG